MGVRFSFEVELVKDDTSEATACRIPTEISSGLGARGRFFVKGTINGKPFRGSLFPYGGIHYLGINQSLREEIGIRAGDILKLELEEDLEPRTITVPVDLAEALAAHPEAADLWDTMSLTRRREAIQSIERAKKPDTRARRVNQAIEILLESSAETKDRNKGH